MTRPVWTRGRYLKDWQPRPDDRHARAQRTPPAASGRAARRAEARAARRKGSSS